MTTQSPTGDMSSRNVALMAGIGLLGMAVLAPFAHFGVLETLVVRTDPTATISNIVGSQGLFRFAIAAFLVVTMLDLVVAWALYVLLRPVNRTAALLVGWFRLAAAAAFLPALANLLDVAQLLGGPARATVQMDQLEAQVMSSIASFGNGWDIMLAIFGLHLLGLGYLLFKSAHFPRFLGALVVIAGVGYLADTFARILIPNFDFTFSLVTFVGEPLLILWLFWKARKGFRTRSDSGDGQVAEPPVPQPAAHEADGRQGLPGHQRVVPPSA